MEGAVRTVLRRAGDVEVTALPDGSVDHRYRVHGGEGAPLSRDAFATAILDGSRSFLLDEVATESGGMAVNAAGQMAALGAETRLLGHLDHPVFDPLACETVSMGAPADVKVLDFESSAVMLTDESEALRTWTLRDARAALGERFESWLGADAVVCSNWSSIPNMTAALEDLAASGVTGGWFVVDPGDVTIRPETDVDDFVQALGALSDAFDVVLNPNDTELAAIARARGISADATTDVLEGLRSDAGIAATVVHAAPEAAVATRGDALRVPNYDTRGPVRFTGGGDHFTGGLAVALATGAEWDVALTLANACATHFVASGETVDGDTLYDFPPQILRSVREPDRPDDDL